MSDLYQDDAAAERDEDRIRAAGWIPASRSKGLNGYWTKPGDGRVLSTEKVLAILNGAEGKSDASGT